MPSDVEALIHAFGRNMHTSTTTASTTSADTTTASPHRRRGAAVASDIESIARQLCGMRLAGAPRGAGAPKGVWRGATQTQTQPQPHHSQQDPKRYTPYARTEALVWQNQHTVSGAATAMARLLTHEVEVTTANGAVFHGTLAACATRERQRRAGIPCTARALQVTNCRLLPTSGGMVHRGRAASSPLVAVSRIFMIDEVSSVQAAVSQRGRSDENTGTAEVLQGLEALSLGSSGGGGAGGAAMDVEAGAPQWPVQTDSAWMDYLTVSRGLEGLKC